MESTNQVRLYFAYGSNLNLDYMRLKCPNPQVLGIARLAGHRVDFFGHSPAWDGAVETVVEDAASEVWGVLYRMDASSWEALDHFQDARFDGNGAYFHYPVAVLDEKGKPVEATIYKKARVCSPGNPSTEYLKLIIQGAEQQGLPEKYIAQLRKVPAEPASYAVPRRPSYSRVGSCMGTGDCSECSGCSE
jgi:gamma-glutamylcyclotransferase (GGCT)/AIG2-like uncharacterized protein YtfP